MLESLSERLIMLVMTCLLCSIVLLRHFSKCCEIMKPSWACVYGLSNQFDVDQDINTILVLSL